MDPYDELRRLDHAAFEQCVKVASAIAINHKLELPAAAAIEKALIEQTLQFIAPCSLF